MESEYLIFMAGVACGVAVAFLWLKVLTYLNDSIND